LWLPLQSCDLPAVPVVLGAACSITQRSNMAQGFMAAGTIEHASAAALVWL
jgi:hypothetical protein